MHIGFEVRKRTVEMFKGLLNEYRNQIEEAYCREDNDLSISFPVKYSPGKKGGIDIEVNINFVAERIKAKSKSNVDERQKVFDFSEKAASIRPMGPGHTEGQKRYLRSRRGLK